MTPRTLPSLLALLVGAAACDFGPVQTVAPDQEGVERIALETATSLEPGDSALADSLGWPSGRVARGSVTIRREMEQIASLDPPQSTALSDSGTALFSDLLGGRYWVWAERRLTDEEIDRLPDSLQATVRAFGGGGFTTVRRGREATPFSVPMQANQADGLVISELSFFVANQKYDYRFFGFIELYNNSDETVYLDGMFIGRGFPISAAVGEWTCGSLSRINRDPDGIWSKLYQEFPGSGNEYPLAPGETVVVATDAIDHSQVVEGYLDLRKVADFEFHGESDVDNPDVPNMIQHRSCRKCVGHGFLLYGHGSVVFLSEHVSPGSLPERRLRGDTPYQRFPRNDIADVAVFDSPSPNSTYDFCPHHAHPDFDRVRWWEIGDPEDNHYNSLQRPVVGTRPNGQPILLDTNTSAVDLELVRPRTPGELPPRQ